MPLFTAYQLGPRSWRPDSSLGDNVADDQVAAHLDETVSTDVMEFMNPLPDQDVEIESVVAFSLSSQTPTPGSDVGTPTPTPGRRSVTPTTCRNTARKTVNFTR